MSVMSGIATDAFHDEFDSELSMLSDDIDASIQASAALQVIRSVGRVPKYMRTVSHGTIIQACFESASLPETIDALESFTGMISEQWKKFRYMLGKWKEEIITATLGVTLTTTLYKWVTIINKENALRNAINRRSYRAIIKRSITNADEAVISTAVVKKGKEFVLKTRVVNIPELVKATLSAQAAADSLVIMGKMDRLEAQQRTMMKVAGRQARASRRLVIILISLLLAIIGLGTITRNTPNALHHAASLELPTDERGLDNYTRNIINIINGGTAFTIFTISDGIGDAPSGPLNKVLNDVIDMSPDDLTAAIKERAGLEKRFAKLADVLQAKADEAAGLDNPYATKAVTFTTTVCKAIIDKCMSSNTLTARLTNKLDKFMDKFHEEANTD